VGTAVASRASFSFLDDNQPGFDTQPSSISHPATSPFTDITLRAGFYQLHLDGRNWPTDTDIGTRVNPTTFADPFWVTIGDLTVPQGAQSGFINGHDQLLEVASDNTTLQFFSINSDVTMGTCQLVITRLK
jgi:hypothetical protein